MPATHPEDRRQFLLYDGRVSSQLAAHLLASACHTNRSQASVITDTLLLCWFSWLRHLHWRDFLICMASQALGSACIPGTQIVWEIAAGCTLLLLQTAHSASLMWATL